MSDKTSLRLIRRIEKRRTKNELTTKPQRGHIETTSNSLRNSVNTQRNHNDITTGTHRNYLEFSADTREFGAIFFVISHPLRRISKPHRIQRNSVNSERFFLADFTSESRLSVQARCAAQSGSVAQDLGEERCAGSGSPLLFKVKGRILVRTVAQDLERLFLLKLKAGSW